MEEVVPQQEKLLVGSSQNLSSSQLYNNSQQQYQQQQQLLLLQKQQQPQAYLTVQARSDIHPMSTIIQSGEQAPAAQYARTAAQAFELHTDEKARQQDAIKHLIFPFNLCAEVMTNYNNAAQRAALVCLLVFSALSFAFAMNILGRYYRYCDFCDLQNSGTQVYSQCYCSMFGTEPYWVQYPTTHWMLWVPVLTYGVWAALSLVGTFFALVLFHQKKVDTSLMRALVVLQVLLFLSTSFYFGFQNPGGFSGISNINLNCKSQQAQVNIDYYQLGFCNFFGAYELFSNASYPLSVLGFIFAAYAAYVEEKKAARGGLDAQSMVSSVEQMRA